MSESLVSQTVIGFSTAPESSYGTNPVLASAFTPMVTRVQELPVTDSEKTDDRGVVGRGNAMYPSFQRSGFRIPTAFEISDVLQVGTLAKLLRRFMGKDSAVPSTVEAGVAFKHIFYEANPDTEGLQLPSTSFIYQNNEYDWLLKGGVGSTYQVTQGNAADPTFTMGIICSGMADRISEIDPAFGSLALPAQDPYMYGASTKMYYTDNLAATISLTAPTHKWRGATFSVNNGLITDDTRAGMPQVDATEPRRGWYRDFLHFGDREVGMEFTMSMDGDYSLKDAEELNTVYTNLTWEFNGDNLSATNKNQIKHIIPKFNLRSPRTGQEGAKRTKTFAAFPLTHAGHYGVYRTEIVNGVATQIS